MQVNGPPWQILIFHSFRLHIYLIEDFFCLFDGPFLLFKGNYNPWKIELMYHKVCSTIFLLLFWLNNTIWSFEKIQLIFDMKIDFESTILALFDEP